MCGSEFPSTQMPPPSLLLIAKHITMTLQEICGELASQQEIAAPGELREPTLPWKSASSFTPDVLLQNTLRRILACALPRQMIPAALPISVVFSLMMLFAT